MKMERNAVGRLVPLEVNERASTPFQGVGAFRPSGTKTAPPIVTCADFPADGNKTVPTLRGTQRLYYVNVV